MLTVLAMPEPETLITGVSTVALSVAELELESEPIRLAIQEQLTESMLTARSILRAETALKALVFKICLKFILDLFIMRIAGILCSISMIWSY